LLPLASPGDIATVYVQFMDAAGNVSPVYPGMIRLSWLTYLSLINK